MTAAERAALRGRYGYRCAYCGVTEADVGAELTVDHFQPMSRDGAGTQANRVYCCFACNCAKGDYWEPDSPQRVLHPLDDQMGSHLVEIADGTLRGLTETGRFHIEQLRLNRPQLVAHRLEKRLREQAAMQSRNITRELADVQREIHQLRERLRQRLRQE